MYRGITDYKDLEVEVGLAWGLSDGEWHSVNCLGTYYVINKHNKPSWPVLTIYRIRREGGQNAMGGFDRVDHASMAIFDDAKERER